MDNRLKQHWDACIVGNGVSSLWLFTLLTNRGFKTLWVSSEAPCDSSRALLQRGWLWNVSAESAAAIAKELRPGTGFLPFESAYYDAKTSKRIRRLGEIKHEWGEHETAYFEALMASTESGTQLDLWNLGVPAPALALARDSFRLEGWPVTEIRTAQNESEKKVESIALTSVPDGDVYSIHADQFFFGDYEGFLPSLVSEKRDAEVLASALKGKASSAGFGLHLVHKPLEAALQQTLIVPLVANPSDRSALSHLTGRFQAENGRLESFWIGFLSAEDVEDNNEILKKIKLAKRAVDRAIPGFAASVAHESVTFEPRMFAVDLLKARENAALGAKLFTDQFGPEAAIRGLLEILPESRC